MTHVRYFASLHRYGLPLEAALALRRSGADPKALRHALRKIEELLDG